ncbi:hypothetical protein MPLB_1990007 [Mesorhizobium sp. ORS 3324]|nr:hypothetical protein MPLB_1990007 [Mesorhizobium sp. ORS 3324]
MILSAVMHIHPINRRKQPLATVQHRRELSH